MPSLRPEIDSEGLLEYSVVFTDRALNHMSRKFQSVMRDISGILKETYRAHCAIVVPGSGTFGMEAVARQFATGRRTLVIRKRLVQLSLDADLRDGSYPVRANRARGPARAQRPSAPFCAAPCRRGGCRNPSAAARSGLCAARGDSRRDHSAR